MITIDLTSLNNAQGVKVSNLDPNRDPYSDINGEVSIIGDINGDGFDDISINLYKDVFNVQSSSYIIFGKAEFSGNMDLTDFGSDNRGFIQSPGIVKGVGDVNNDNCDDIIIASGANYYVIFGNPNIRETDLTTFTSGEDGFIIEPSSSIVTDANFFSTSNSYLLYPAGKAGDVNGDGYSDIMLANSNAAPNSRPDSGEVYIIFGKANGFSDIDLSNTLTSEQGFSIQGAEMGDRLGIAISKAGDVNGDGLDDIVLGANKADPNSLISAGAAYVIFGKVTGFSNIDLANFSSGKNGFVIQGGTAGEQLGLAVNDAGDINGDGYDDILIGSDYSTSCYVIYGKKTAFSSFNVSNVGDGWGIKIQASEISKRGLGALGDVNNDKYDDIIIGTSSVTGSSASYIIFGQENLPATISFLVEANIPTNTPILKGAGKLVGGGGDINKDGYSDVILASDLKNDGAYIVYALDICNDYKYQTGDEADNIFIGNNCPFIYDGREGRNQISYSYSTEWVLVDLNKGEGEHGDALDDKYTNIQDVVGSPYDDILRGNELDNKLYGMEGNDRLEDVGGGNDEFTGNEGDDQFVISREAGVVTITDFQKGDNKVNLINFPEIAQFADILKITDSGEDSILNLLPEKKVKLKGVSKDDLLESNFLFAVNPNLKAVEVTDKSFWNDQGGRELTWAIVSPILTTAILALLGWSWKEGGFCCNKFKSFMVAKFASDAIQTAKAVNTEIMTEEAINMFALYFSKEPVILEHNEIEQDCLAIELNMDNFSIINPSVCEII